MFTLIFGLLFLLFDMELYAEKILYPKNPEDFVHWKKVTVGENDVYLNLQNNEKMPAIAGEYYQVSYEKEGSKRFVYLRPVKPASEDEYFYICFDDALQDSIYKNALGYFGQEKNAPKKLNPSVLRAARTLSDKKARYISCPVSGTRYYQKVGGFTHTGIDKNLNALNLKVTIFRSTELFKNYLISEEIDMNKKTVRLIDPRTELNWLRISLVTFSVLASTIFYYLKCRPKK